MRGFVSLFLLLSGLVVIYFLWPETPSLPKIGTVNEWTLTEVSGEDVSVHNKPKLITFFYTNCPDICPTTMIDLMGLQQYMQEKGISNDEYLIVSVTLDPVFDTKERILKYKDVFGISSPNWLFLRGTEEETKQFTQYFNFIYKKNQDGFLSHSISMYAVDSNNQIRSHHDMAVGNKKVNIEEIAENLIQLIEEAG
ncbi:SCO family protein [Paenisporosarcina indica]|uniref:SCO family protein n=1 Tax=Paenisporosarcina indica TaxID=650093 RepID=UPI00094FBB2A|nr:SCO family protein [Paenisporosarcina indica]